MGLVLVSVYLDSSLHCSVRLVFSLEGSKWAFEQKLLCVTFVQIWFQVNLVLQIWFLSGLTLK